MTLTFKLLMWLMIVGLLIDGLALLQLTLDGTFGRTALAVATPMFAVGTVGA